MSNSTEIHASFHLSYFSSLPPALHHSLLSAFFTAAACVRAGPKAWAERALITADAVISFERGWEEAARFADRELREVVEKNIRLYLWQNPDYPTLLKKVSAAPPIIYALGQPLLEDALPLAIVGSRRPTYYGEKIAREFAGELADLGVVAVSGLARGIDSRVHDETIRRNGVTWAVLGSGLLNLYPRENKALAERILDKGTLLSEFPLHTPPYRGHFPRRNRVIAGLSVGTIIVEGDEKSGSLITARLAAEEGREVFAVPGPVSSSLSRGPHRLIQNGAALVTCVDDVIDALPNYLRERLAQSVINEEKDLLALSSDHAKLMRELEATALPREILSERLKMPNAALAAALLELELRGVVRSLPGGLVEKT